ncbi:hypothetical protein BGW41_007566 [Actinomortierella wolfii]|nr:hypothetical protein BGW41_007566 [Actinomortierella wolfii]
MHVLTRAEEEVLFKAMKAKALKECDPIVKEFVECTHGKTVTVLWACRAQHKAMNKCLMALTTQEHLDKLKIQYLKDLAEGKVDHAKLQREAKEHEEAMKKKRGGGAAFVH